MRKPGVEDSRKRRFSEDAVVQPVVAMVMSLDSAILIVVALELDELTGHEC